MVPEIFLKLIYWYSLGRAWSKWIYIGKLSSMAFSYFHFDIWKSLSQVGIELTWATYDCRSFPPEVSISRLKIVCSLITASKSPLQSHAFWCDGHPLWLTLIYFIYNYYKPYTNVSRSGWEGVLRPLMNLWAWRKGTWH